jgi:hypothetical protein
MLLINQKRSVIIYQPQLISNQLLGDDLEASRLVSCRNTKYFADSAGRNQVNQHPSRSFCLAGTVIAALSGFLIHSSPIAFQAGFRFCSSNASAASSPRAGSR